MAKRYMKSEQLAGRDNGPYKPGGTMGSHHCSITHTPNGIRVVGSLSGDVTIGEGDTLGYDCGQVWRIAAPKTMFDKWRQDNRVRVVREKPTRLLETFYGRGNPDHASSWITENTTIYQLDHNGGVLKNVVSDRDKEVQPVDKGGNTETLSNWEEIVIDTACVAVIESLNVKDPYTQSRNGVRITAYLWEGNSQKAITRWLEANKD